MNTPLNSTQRPLEENKVLNTATSARENSSQLEADGAVKGAAVLAETTANAGEILAGMEGSEIKEHAQGAVREDQKATSGSQQTTAADPAAQIRAQLQDDSTPPTEKVLVRKIKHAVAQEMKTLEKTVKNLQRNALKFTRELAIAFDQLRHLKKMLKDITTFTLEFLQMLFQKVQKKESLATVEY